MLIFLDIDGVCHPVNRSCGTFSCLKRLESVFRRYPVQIVISSAWRVDHSLEALRGFFSTDIALRTIGTTPDFTIPGFDLDYRCVREKEIDAWRRTNRREHDVWLAIDDCDWLFTPDCRNLLLINGQTGFDERAEATLLDRMRTGFDY